MDRADVKPRSECISEQEERAARQAAAGEKRGGGERGLMERRKFCGSRRLMNGAKIVEAASVTGVGSTNKPGEIAGRSIFWQQDMEQAAMPGIWWPQSLGFSEPLEECWG
jgi:hypothetical protein